MEIAPLSRRLGALAIDVLVGLPGFAGMAAVIVAVARPWKKPPLDPQSMRQLWMQPWIQGLGLVTPGDQSVLAFRWSSGGATSRIGTCGSFRRETVDWGTSK